MKSELFKLCLKQVLKWEGGYVNDPDDKGGATNKGITQAVYNRYTKSTKPVKDIKDGEVEDIYYRNYWLPSKCDEMNPKFAALCFDTSVNMGLSRTKEFLKEAEYKYPDKFIEARRNKYYEFAKYGNQKKFLKGWLNRLSDLERFISNLGDSYG